MYQFLEVKMDVRGRQNKDVVFKVLQKRLYAGVEMRMCVVLRFVLFGALGTIISEDCCLGHRLGN